MTATTHPSVYEFGVLPRSFGHGTATFIIGPPATTEVASSSQNREVLNNPAGPNGNAVIVDGVAIDTGLHQLAPATTTMTKITVALAMGHRQLLEQTRKNK